MIPARIGKNARKNFTIPDGTYNGYWEDYFCCLYLPGTKNIFCCFNTATKCKKKHGEKITAKVNVCDILLYETLKQKQL